MQLQTSEEIRGKSSCRKHNIHNIKTINYDFMKNTTLADTWDVIVSSYMRSGSTFIGTNIGHREDAFYWYEPLLQNFDWKYYRKDGKLCDALTPTCGKR